MILYNTGNKLNTFIESENNFYGFKVFRLVNNKLYSYYMDDFEYVFNMNGETIEFPQSQDIRFAIPFTNVNKNVILTSCIVSETKKEMGYHISPLSIIEEYDNPYEKETIVALIKFKREDIEFYDGTDLVVKKFSIPSTEENESILNKIKNLYSNLIININDIKTVLTRGNSKILEIINNNFQEEK